MFMHTLLLEIHTMYFFHKRCFSLTKCFTFFKEVTREVRTMSTKSGALIQSP